jgi:hypothetical protein
VYARHTPQLSPACTPHKQPKADHTYSIHERVDVYANTVGPRNNPSEKYPVSAKIGTHAKLFADYVLHTVL